MDCGCSDFHGAGAVTGAVDDVIHQGTPGCFNISCFQGLEGCFAHDGAVNLPNPQQPVEHGGGFAHHFVGGAEARQILIPVQQFQQRLYAPLPAGMYPITPAQYADVASGFRQLLRFFQFLCHAIRLRSRLPR